MNVIKKIKLPFILLLLIAALVTYIFYDKAVIVNHDKSLPAQIKNNQAVSNPSLINNPKTIAVLPFVNVSNENEQEFFADGLTEELLNKIAKIPKLKVIARTSSFFYKDTNEDLRVIGKKLGVKYILEGSVRKSDDMVRISAKLIHASDGFQLWSQIYDRSFKNVLDIQDEISVEVAKALNIVLDAKSTQAMKSSGVSNVDAFIAYQKGLQLYDLAHGHGKDKVEVLTQANLQFDIAIKLEPEFASAYFHQSDLFSHILLYATESDEQLAIAHKKLSKSLQSAALFAKDPLLKLYININNILHSNDWNLLPTFADRAADYDSCLQPLYFPVLLNFGYQDTLMKIYQYIINCDPLNPIGYYGVATTELHNWQPEQALILIAKGEQLTGRHDWYTLKKIIAYFQLKDFDEATRAIESLKHRPLLYKIHLATLHAMMGNGETGLAYIKELRETKPSNYIRYSIVLAAAIGNVKLANELAAALDAKPAGSFQLMQTVFACGCGAPFDINHTPNFKRRIEEAKFSWPPKSILLYPNKNW
ncbi:hypothetical protein RGQ13_01740 [Thalassotalea psychrophila]|uniref:Adenylate cyclase n=1 Tax=Thalassotalea psychrophila TaxID=3065647 RepID=A0ABY9TVB7_9GAMM|nr:hypothetical protein RGQ13_01740 [Colwelliaceae bacterium SQ149]